MKRMPVTLQIWRAVGWAGWMRDGIIEVQYVEEHGVLITVPQHVDDQFDNEDRADFITWLAITGKIPRSYMVFDWEDGQYPIVWHVNKKPSVLARLAQKLLQLFS